jgi:hypothetical protein
MRAPPEPPHIDASAEGLSFKQYARAFCTFCCPIGERHREIELSWRRKHDPKNLEAPLNPNFYLLPVGEHQLAPCCASALWAFRWWAWLDATLSNGRPEEVQERLASAKRYRPEWVSEDGKLVGISHPEGRRFTSAQRYEILTWLYRASHPINGAVPERRGRGRPPSHEVDAYIKIFLSVYAAAGGDPHPSRTKDEGELTHPSAIYLATIWGQLPSRFGKVSKGTLSRRGRDVMSGMLSKRRARGSMTLRNKSAVKLFGVAPGSVFELPANRDPDWSTYWSMRPVDFEWEHVAIGALRRSTAGWVSARLLLQVGQVTATARIERLSATADSPAT